MNNWKTTLAGLGAAFAYTLLVGIQGGLAPKDAVIAAGLGLIGLFAKDHNVTGGTRPQ